MNGLIYVARNKINGKQYVGQTVKDFERRKAQHISDALLERDKTYFHNSIRTHREEAFEWAIIVEGIENRESLNELERYWIKELGTKDPNGYNLTDGGEGVSGWKPTEETRKKQSEVHKGLQAGEKSPMYGKHQTSEAKKKMSENYPRVRAVYQLNKVTKEIIIEYHCIREAERKTGVANSSISKCCKGKQKSAGGFCWCYVEDYERLYGNGKSQTVS